MSTEPVKNALLKTRQQGRAVQKNIYHRPVNVWEPGDLLDKYSARLSEKIIVNLKTKIYASYVEATGPLIKNNKIYEYYTEHMQLIPYEWAQDIPLQMNPISLEIALIKKSKNIQSYKFRPDERFLSVADRLLDLTSEELISELGNLFKHGISEVKVNQKEYLNIFYNEDISLGGKNERYE